MNLDKDFFIWCYQKDIPFDTARAIASFIAGQCDSKTKELQSWKADAIERIAELEKENAFLRKENAKVGELEKKYEALRKAIEVVESEDKYGLLRAHLK